MILTPSRSACSTRSTAAFPGARDRRAARPRPVRPGAARPRPGHGPDGRDPADADPLPHAGTSTCRGRSPGSTPRTRSARSSGRSSPGFFLIELLGLTGTLLVGAACSGSPASPRSLTRARAAPTPARRPRSARRPPSTIHGAAPSPRPPGRPPPAARPGSPSLVAFVSGLTSLGYQTLWTRLLSSGTGNSTYVFSSILAIFLIGLVLGATLFTRSSGRGSPGRSPLLAIAQVVVALVAHGLVLVIGQPGGARPVEGARDPLRRSSARSSSSCSRRRS